MEYHHKKLLTIVCEAVLEERLSRDVRRLGAHGHTVTDAVHAVSHTHLTLPTNRIV